jgi:hypothetical protein
MARIHDTRVVICGAQRRCTGRRLTLRTYQPLDKQPSIRDGYENPQGGFYRVVSPTHDAVHEPTRALRVDGCG